MAKEFPLESVEVKEEVKICRRTTINNMVAYRQENKDKPWITCFMLYYGRYDVAQEAVESFLAQTYTNKKLTYRKTCSVMGPSILRPIA